MSQSYNQLGVAPPKRTFLDGRAPPSAAIAEHAYLGNGTTYPPAPPVGGSGYLPARPQTSGANARGSKGTGMAMGGGGGGGGGGDSKMVISPVPPSHASLLAQGAGPKTTEAVLLVEHKVELTDILHESLALLDNVYRTKHIFGQHLRYVDPSYSGDAVHRMNLMTPPAFDPAYQHSIGSNVPASVLGAAAGGGMGGAFGVGVGVGGVGGVGAGARLPSQLDGIASNTNGGTPTDGGGQQQGSPSGGPNVNGAASPAAGGGVGGAGGDASGSAAANNGGVTGSAQSGNGSAANGGGNNNSAQAANAQTDRLKQRLRTAEVFVKKLYNRTAQLDTEVAFYRDELRRMQVLCGLSRSPATTLSVTDGHIPLNHPLYAPRYRRRCRSAPPTRTLLRTAIGGFGLRFPFPTSGSNNSNINGGANVSGGNGLAAAGAGGLAAGGGFANISQNPFSKKRQGGNGNGNGGGRRYSPRRQSGPFNNGSEEEDEESEEEDDGHEMNTAFAAASTDAANAAVQGMRRRIMQLTEAVVMLQQENTTLRTEKANRLTYRDALLTEYIVARDRTLAQLRASLQDVVTKVNNPMRLLRARQPNPGTNPAVATNNILQEVYQRLASEINALVGDIVTGGSAAVVNTNAVLMGNGASNSGGGGADGGGSSRALLASRDPMEGDYEEVRGGFEGGLRPIGGGASRGGGGGDTTVSRSAVIPAIEVGGGVASRPGTSSGAAGTGEHYLQIPSAAPLGGSRRVSGTSAGDDNGGEGLYGPNTVASVAAAGGNNYLLTCHGCGSCVPLLATNGSGGPSSVPTLAVVGGGAGIAASSSAAANAAGGGNNNTNGASMILNLRPTSSDVGRSRAGGGGGDVDALEAMLSGDGPMGLNSASGGAGALSANGVGSSAAGGGGSGFSSASASLPIGCGLTQSATRRRELLTRLKPIVEALPLPRKKQLLHLMCELRHLFDCLVLSHRTLLARYDDDRKESHRQTVQLQVSGSLLRDQIGELEARLAAISAAALRQEHAMQQAAIAARGY